jgi:hypothetical protein
LLIPFGSFLSHEYGLTTPEKTTACARLDEINIPDVLNH